MRYILVLLAILTGCQEHKTTTQKDRAVGVSPIAYEVCFSPGTECESTFVRYINAAESEILVQAYGFTSEPIAQALVRAKRRGVTVRVLVDKSEVKQKSEAEFLSSSGIEVRVDAAHPIAHNKVMIIDNTTTITGSYNVTNQARHNAENAIFIRDPQLAATYRANWLQHSSHSVGL